MFNDIVKFVEIDYIPNDSGDVEETRKEREVFADIKSIGMQEFYQAQANGYKPELAIVIADYSDYQNEPLLIYNEIEYKIIRTFRKDESCELKIIVTSQISNI